MPTQNETNVVVSDQVLTYLKDPTKICTYRLEQLKYDDLYKCIEYDPLDDVEGIYDIYRLIQQILTSSSFKLKAVCEIWADATTALNDDEIELIQIGVNYEIWEALLQLLKLGTFYLPALGHGNYNLSHLKNMLHRYVQQANYARPNRFGICGERKFTHVLSNDERVAIDNGKFLKFEITTTLSDIIAETEYTEKDIRDRIKSQRQSPTIHTGFGKIRQVYQTIDWVFDYLPAHQIMEESTHVVQEVILILLETMFTWDNSTIFGLLKDDQLLHGLYMVAKSTSVKNVTTLPYFAWRENQLISIIDPSLTTAPRIC